MRPEDLKAFADRPWAEITEFDTEYWKARKRELGAIEGFRVAAELRELVRVQRPDWPTAEDRRRDLESHRRVSEGLRSVARERLR